MSERNFNSCPFCGSSQIRMCGGIGYLQAECVGCFTTGPKFSSGASCETHWNTRARHIGKFVSVESVIQDTQQSISVLHGIIKKLESIE